MKIVQQPEGYKPLPRFVKISVNDTQYAFYTPKYVVDVEYACSNFYAPDFYRVSVKNRQGNTIWDGKKSTFLDTLFVEPFISDRYDTMILNRVNDTGNSNSQQLILIDLVSGTEAILTPEGYFTRFGHIQSFNAIYFSAADGIQCKELETGHEFMLKPLLSTYLPLAEAWGVCPVQDCILVFSKTKENNIALFNLKTRQIQEQQTIQWEDAERVNWSFNNILQEQSTVLTASYSHKAPNGYWAHTKSVYYKIDF
ncbi:MAG: hypothetical protein U0T77_01435 [Chitinophagales bacterium]